MFEIKRNDHGRTGHASSFGNDNRPVLFFFSQFNVDISRWSTKKYRQHFGALATLTSNALTAVRAPNLCRKRYCSLMWLFVRSFSFIGSCLFPCVVPRRGVPIANATATLSTRTRNNAASPIVLIFYGVLTRARFRLSCLFSKSQICTRHCFRISNAFSELLSKLEAHFRLMCDQIENGADGMCVYI